MHWRFVLDQFERARAINMKRVIETIGGMWELFRLAAKTRFRMRGKYWTWRSETAFGIDPSKMPNRRQRWRAMIDYGKWVRRMRKRI